MVESKPKRSTFFALVVFLVLLYGGLGLVIWAFVSAEQGAWWHYVGMLGLGLLALGITSRVMISHKVLTLAKETLSVRYPFRFKTTKYLWKDLKGWQEITIETKGEDFKVIEFYFVPKFKVSISRTENTNYQEVLAFLQKRFAKIEVHGSGK